MHVPYNDSNSIVLPEEHWIVLVFFAIMTKMANTPIKELMPLVIDGMDSCIQTPSLIFHCAIYYLSVSVQRSTLKSLRTEAISLTTFVQRYCIAHSHPSC